MFFDCHDTSPATGRGGTAGESYTDSSQYATLDNYMDGHCVRLLDLATELLHKIALSGWLDVKDVAALSQTCKRMKAVFVDDQYGRDIHHALEGVVKNVQAERWESARYAVLRRCFEEEDGGEEEVWKRVVEAGHSDFRSPFADGEELARWERVVVAALSLPGAKVCWDKWNLSQGRRGSMVSLLSVASTCGAESVVGWAVERGGNVEVADEGGFTPLFHAVREGHLGVAKLLVEEGGADVGVTGKYGQNVLHMACANGGVDVVEYVLGQGVVDVNAKSKQGLTAMNSACSRGYLDVVKVLVEAGADADLEGMQSAESSPLLLACKKGHAGVVEYLLGLGVEKDAELLVRGLLLAGEQGHAATVRLLLDAGVGVDDCLFEGHTALVAAASYMDESYADVVKVLLDAGADTGKVIHGNSEYVRDMFLEMMVKWGIELDLS